MGDVVNIGPSAQVSWASDDVPSLQLAIKMLRAENAELRADEPHVKERQARRELLEEKAKSAEAIANAAKCRAMLVALQGELQRHGFIFRKGLHATSASGLDGAYLRYEGPEKPMATAARLADDLADHKRWLEEAYAHSRLLAQPQRDFTALLAQHGLTTIVSNEGTKIVLGADFTEPIPKGTKRFRRNRKVALPLTRAQLEKLLDDPT